MLQLQMETINVCNAACVFCPYPKMQRPKGWMTPGLSTKIMTEAADIPQITHVTFTGLGEPLLDRELENRIHKARSLNRNWMIDVYTNGHSLTHDRAISLAETGLDVLYVSLNAVKPSQRVEIMKLDDYDKVVEQIRFASDLKAYKVVVKGISSKDLFEVGDHEQFFQNWGGTVASGGQGFLHLEGNWAGAMYPMRTKPTSACGRALNQIMVLWDGRVSLCCFDGEGEEILGDLNTQTIREMFNGPKALGIRTAHNEGRRATIPLCANCTAI